MSKYLRDTTLYLLNIKDLDNSYENTFNFNSKQAQEAFFMKCVVRTFYNCSYIRKDNYKGIKIPINIDEIYNINYVMYNNNGKMFYAFITNKEFISNDITLIDLEIDVIQTYLFDHSLENSFIERCHVDRWDKNGNPTTETVKEDLGIGDYTLDKIEHIYKYNDSYLITSSVPLGRIGGNGDDLNDNGYTESDNGGSTGGDIDLIITGKYAPSKNLIYYIKEMEGFCSGKYRCPAGVLTQGYGFTGKELVDGNITEAQASVKLLKIIQANYCTPVLNRLNDTAKKNLTQGQVDCLTDMAYNMGASNFSSLINKINQGIKDRATIEPLIKSYNKARNPNTGQLEVLPGLVKRRAYNCAMFFGDLLNVQVPGYNKKVHISIISESTGKPTGQYITDNNGYGKDPYETGTPILINNKEDLPSVYADIDGTVTNFDIRYDTWRTDYDNSVYGLYFYYLDKNTLAQSVSGGTVYNSKIIGSTQAIQSVLYAPYIDPSNLAMRACFYDNERLGDIEHNNTDTVLVYRILGYRSKNDSNKVLGDFKTYPDYGKSIGGEFRWQNESKLYQFPYSYAMINDYLSTPLEVKYHLCNKASSTLKVKTSLSDKGTYGLYIQDYAGDTLGQSEIAIANGSLDLPVSSSAYNNFCSTSKAQFQASTITALNNSLGSFARNFMSSNVSGGINDIMGMANSAINQQAVLQDLRNAPRSISTMGGDIPFAKMMAQNTIDLLRYRLTDEYMQRLGSFFHMYGYKQDKLMKVDLRSRKYFNYVKCYKANIFGSRIDKEDMRKIKAIYENGITFWHLDRGAIPLDYSKDNPEI